MNNQSLFVDLINQKRKYKKVIVAEKALEFIRELENKRDAN